VKALIQRVSEAKVTVDSNIVGEIGRGWLVFLGLGQTDTGAEIPILIHKLLGLRLFSDDQGQFNLSVQDVGASILVVSQFTLYADCTRGRRPGFQQAADPKAAQALYQEFIGQLRKSGMMVAEGVFGADMNVSLVNDGPVTVLLDSDDFMKPRL
jgi:D-aminoacyl-tRNA deacylase